MKLAYRDFGTGQPLIILHGLFGQSDNWNTLAKQFSEQGFHVYTIDQRNHGLSPHHHEWDYELMADDLHKFINDHQIQNPILMGHSMGGKTVMFFEKKYPGIADKIIIADISPRAYEPHHAEVLKALHAVDFKEIKTRKEAEAKMNEHIQDFGTKQFLLKNIYWRDSDSNLMDWRFNLKTISENYDNVSVKVPHFTSNSPCLIIKGERSSYITENDKEEFRSMFSDCKFETIAAAGHWVHAEKPKEYFDVVMKFIGN